MTRLRASTGNWAAEDAATYWYHPDHLGSSSVVTDPDGEAYERIEYTPFGEMWLEHQHDANTRGEGYIPFRFTSKEWDEETGLYYYGARYLEPKLSRWMSADPAGFGLVNPNRKGFSVVEALNWYSYVSNNPVKYVDPTGLVIRWIQSSGVSNQDFARAQAMGRNIKNSNTEAGKRWRAAEQSDKTVVIEVNIRGENYSRPGDDKEMTVKEKWDSALGKGGDAYVRFDPTDTKPMTDGSPGNPEATLAHEMGHAYLQITGRNPVTRKGRELDATAIDNQYRDWLGVRQRQVYGKGTRDWNVPQYNSNTDSFSIYGTGRPYKLREVK